MTNSSYLLCKAPVGKTVRRLPDLRFAVFPDGRRQLQQAWEDVDSHELTWLPVDEVEIDPEDPAA